MNFDIKKTVESLELAWEWIPMLKRHSVWRPRGCHASGWGDCLANDNDRRYLRYGWSWTPRTIMYIWNETGSQESFKRVVMIFQS